MFTKIETEENPKMFEVYLNHAYHQVFCYGFAHEESPGKDKKLLFTLVSGSDSALQSMKGAIDIGSYGIRFGYGEKELTGWKFKSEQSLFCEKGKYQSFPMTLSQNRKALAIVHEEILNNTKYVLSFESNPADDIAQLLGGSSYGLHILPEWRDTVLDELIRHGHLVEHELYIDNELFDQGMHLYSINLTEEEADTFIEILLKQGKITFPKEGTGNAIAELTDLPSYLTGFMDDLVFELSKRVEVTHDPTKSDSLSHFNQYPRELFPVQAHVATAAAKTLRKQKAIIIQGEMSTGKSSIMTAVADGLHAMKNKKGYHACLMCPPSLTKKWPNEIRELIPNAKVIVVKETRTLIDYHNTWTRNGRPKPTVPTFFIISFTSMRGDCRLAPAIKLKYKYEKVEGELIKSNSELVHCPSCGKIHQVVESVDTVINENGQEIQSKTTHDMSYGEFGSTRRLKNGKMPANAFCNNSIEKSNKSIDQAERVCGNSFWTKSVPNRYESFKEWAAYEKKLLHALKQNDKRVVRHVINSQPEPPKRTGSPRRVSAIEYIRRKMKNFFDISIVDEVHELKGGMTAQGHSLGSLASVSKKVIAGTGTLFGGKAEDIYYLLWRLFPHEMVATGYKFEEVTKFNEEFGNIESTVVIGKDGYEEYSNTQSRGGERNNSKKVMPGISPFIFGKYMMHNVINVKLRDVWPDPVDLIDTPTIFVDMDKDLRERYRSMIGSFEHAIDSREDGFKLYLPMTDFGISYPDNPFTFPDATFKNLDGTRDLIWRAEHLDENRTLPKEKKLQEIIETEMSEGRKSIVYVRDTGSSVGERDVRPRLKAKLEEIGAKVCILDTGTTKTDQRSEWLKQKIEDEGYDVCIVSQELVKVGLDLLCTPTLIYYQFSWSLFTINQSSRRSWRIGQTSPCRLFYLSYKDTFQENMAHLIALKNKATAAINGDVSSDGLSAMLGDDDGDLQSMLIQSVKNGGSVMKGSAEDWISQTSDKARELLANIGKKKKVSVRDQFKKWVDIEIKGETTKNAILMKIDEILKNIQSGLISGFTVTSKEVLEVDLIEAFGFDRAFIADGKILMHLTMTKQTPKAPSNDSEIASKLVVPSVQSDQGAAVTLQFTTKVRKKSKKKAVDDLQIAFDLFA